MIKAGFLSYSSDTTNVNLYGILATAALTGLFTDKATMKLKEIFEVIFKSTDDRGGKLSEIKVTVTSVLPEKIDITNLNKIIIAGENLDKKKLIIKINDAVIKDPVINASSINFPYSVAPTEIDKKTFRLVITDDAGKVIHDQTWEIKQSSI